MRETESGVGHGSLEVELSKLFAAAYDPVVCVDREGVVRAANAAWFQLTGCAPDAILGGALSQLYPSPRRVAQERALRRLLRSSDLRPGAELELELVHADGHLIHARASLSAPLGRASEPRSALFIREASDRMEALRRSEARFRTLVENATIAMALSDEQGRLVEANPAYCSFLGYAADELRGMPINRLTHPEDRKAGVAAFRDLMEGKREVIHMEQRMLRQDGAVVWGMVTASLVQSAEGRFVIGMVQDLTERLRAERAIRESQEKSRFLATMSHELRTPLNSILGFADLLASGQFGQTNERQDRYIGNIRSSGQHLLELVNELLDFGRIEAGQLDVPLTALPIGPVVEQCLAEVRPLADAKGLALTMTLEPDLLANSNRLRLRQVLLNLLSNAIKFTAAGGRITVSTEADERVVRIAVADSGVGIPVEQQEQIFQEFAQVEDGTRREGAGMGLTLSRRLVELMRGTLTVASQPGLGSRFTITLARAMAPRRRGARRDRVDELAELAYMDALTGLPNRRAFEEAWKRELASARRHSYPVSLAIVDIDHFKRVNDRLGHLEGDRVLKSVGDILRRTVRSADVVARLAGDEFIVALPYTNLEGALRIAERLRRGVAALTLQLPCQVSVGIACSEQTPDEALMAIADKALYLAKSEGRNRVAAERP